MNLQHTIAKPVSLSGRGLFGGEPVNVRFEPAEADHGIVFRRTDLSGLTIPARVDHVVRQQRRTSLRNGTAVIDTVEHCLSALAAMQIDNVVVELDAAELPAGDGSARPFLDVLSQAGTKQMGQVAQHRFKITEPVIVQEGDATLAAMPCDDDALHIVYELEYPSETGIGRQLLVYDSAHDSYAEQLASARTFVLEAEAKALQQAGMGEHLTEKDVLVVGPTGPLGGNSFRFRDELARHKVVDLIGDLYLIGAPIVGRIVAHRSGHPLNHALVRELVRRDQSAARRKRLAESPQMIDVRALMRILPHRYPMLLVDRVIELEEERRIVGVKNVTINEPFFQGHYPTSPVMPGVLIVEAMAQLSGVLIGQRLEHTGKLAFLMSLDRVKIRRPVIPGDQLTIEAEAVRVRSRIAQMVCKAFVGDEVAAEAEVKFMLVDNEQG